MIRSDVDATERSICAAIRGVSGVWRDLPPAGEGRLLADAARHRVKPLLASRLHAAGELANWPRAIAGALRDAARAEAAIEITRALELRRLLAGFASAHVPVVVFKGAALAYSAYEEPWLRPREDTDVLVRVADADRARGVLSAAGYHPAPMQSGALVSHQRVYLRRDGAGGHHACDLHWKIANPAAFADLVSTEDLLRDAASISLDGVTAHIPSRVDALLLACWHRVSHHQDSDNLLWLYDLHLLAEGMNEADAARVIDTARRTRTAAVCARGLALAADRFGTAMPPTLLAHLAAERDASPRTAAYLRRDARKVDLLAADLRALPDWRSRLRLVREHLFPPAEYMFAVTGRSARAALPMLYARRIARGALQWFRRPTRLRKATAGQADDREPAFAKATAGQAEDREPRTDDRQPNREP